MSQRMTSKEIDDVIRYWECNEDAHDYVPTTLLDAAIQLRERLQGMKIELIPKCVDCGTTDNVESGPCPYEHEINDDDTYMDLCESCSDRRGDDI